MPATAAVAKIGPFFAKVTSSNGRHPDVDTDDDEEEDPFELVDLDDGLSAPFALSCVLMVLENRRDTEGGHHRVLTAMAVR